MRRKGSFSFVTVSGNNARYRFFALSPKRNSSQIHPQPKDPRSWPRSASVSPHGVLRNGKGLPFWKMEVVRAMLFLFHLAFESTRALGSTTVRIRLSAYVVARTKTIKILRYKNRHTFSSTNDNKRQTGHIPFSPRPCRLLSFHYFIACQDNPSSSLLAIRLEVKTLRRSFIRIRG
jgi:hypothetical protein